jgi:hypothetical protein
MSTFTFGGGNQDSDDDDVPSLKNQIEEMRVMMEEMQVKLRDRNQQVVALEAQIGIMTAPTVYNQLQVQNGSSNRYYSCFFLNYMIFTDVWDQVFEALPCAQAGFQDRKDPALNFALEQEGTLNVRRICQAILLRHHERR